MDRALGPSGGNTVSSCTDTVPGEMPLVLILTPLLFGLSFISGMLGLGGAFIAIRVLGLFGFDLKDVIQPWALLLSRPRVRPGGGAPC